MYKVRGTKKYKKSFKKLLNAGLVKREEVEKIINVLKQGLKLDAKYRDHQLKGKFSQCRECHVRGDLLLVYEKDEEELILVFVNIGTHSQLFG